MKNFTNTLIHIALATALLSAVAACAPTRSASLALDNDYYYTPSTSHFTTETATNIGDF